jgi:hypothetical protein
MYSLKSFNGASKSAGMQIALPLSEPSLRCVRGGLAGSRHATGRFLSIRVSPLRLTLMVLL